MADNISNIQQGLSHLQQLFISESRQNILACDQTVLSGDTSIALYTKEFGYNSYNFGVGSSGIHSSYTKNSYGLKYYGDSISFGCQVVAQHLYLTNLGFFILDRTGTPNVYLSNNVLYIECVVSPTYARNGDRDINYDLYWDSACTDKSERTIRFQISGYLCKDTSNLIALSEFKSAAYS